MSIPQPQSGYPTPNSDSATTTHSNPPLPYVASFPGGVYPGRAVLVRGLVPESAKGARFQIDLCCGLLVQGDHCDDKALHFNPRFNIGASIFKSGDSDFVLNSLINNKWGAEERYKNTLDIGQPFTIRILILQDYFKIALNGTHLCDYMHRLPLNNITSVYVDGSVRIDFIEYQGNSDPIPAPNANEETATFEPVLVRKPPVPFVYKIASGGFLPPRVLRLTATPRMSAVQFTFNILKGSEYLFHLRADFPGNKDPSGAMVRNSTANGQWLREERHMNSFPFSAGITFDMIVTAAPDHLKVEIDGAHFCNFVYRPHIRPAQIDSSTIVGDLTIQKFEII